MNYVGFELIYVGNFGRYFNVERISLAVDFCESAYSVTFRPFRRNLVCKFFLKHENDCFQKPDGFYINFKTTCSLKDNELSKRQKVREKYFYKDGLKEHERLIFPLIKINEYYWLFQKYFSLLKNIFSNFGH